MVTIDWATFIIHVPQAALTPLGGGRFGLDIEAFRNTLKNIEDTDEGMPFSVTHARNAPVLLSGVTYAQTFEILPPYTVSFENTGTPYIVVPSGANHNLGDKTNFDGGMSLVIGNAAGLIAVSTSGTTGPTVAEIAAEVWSHINRTLTSAGAGGATAAEVWSYGARTLTSSPVPPTAAENAAAVRADLTPELTQLTKVSKIHGVGVPLVVTPTSRVAGDLSQTIATVGDTTTVSAA